MSIVRAAELDLSTTDVLRAAALFGVAATERIGGFENLLHRSTAPPGRVLRFTHGARRTPGMIQAEFEFMSHLADCGMAVPAPIESLTGSLVARFEAESGDDVLVTCMEEAPGRHRDRSEWSEDDVVRYGELVGALHVAAEDFEPGSDRRPPWSDPIFDVGFDAADAELHSRVAAVRAACMDHPAGGTGLLIHQDAHPGNLHLTDDGQITLFDFDDCAYGTPTHDVAIVLFYWLLGVDDPSDATRTFVAPFIQGYEHHATLPPDWPGGADLFLSLRESEIYFLLTREPEDDWFGAEQRFMVGRRDRILDGIPYLGRPLAELL